MPLESGSDPGGEDYSRHGTSYEFESVIADLIDNSIDAEANTVSVMISDQQYPAGPVRGKSENYPSGLPFLHDEHLFAIIADDGRGMDPTSLKNSIVYGKRRKYEEWELGHYGVGLKQSSASQAYELSIFTKSTDGVLSFIRRSSTHVQSTNRDEWLEETDLVGDYAWMAETRGFSMAKKRIEELSSGTVVLLEGLHKLESRINPADRPTAVDEIKTYVKNHLRLIFHYYLSPGGAKIPLTSGAERSRSLSISFNNEPLTPLDPFLREFARDEYGTLQHELSIPTITPQGEMNSNLHIWILPNDSNPLYPEVGVIEEDLKSSRRGLNRQTLQGIFLYRNRRLIDYGNDGWKTVRTIDPGQTRHRWELHLPPGAQIGDVTQSDFLVNNTKSQVDPSTDFITRLKDANGRFKKQWHPGDPKNRIGSMRRAEFRNKREGKHYLQRLKGEGKSYFPACKFCKSHDHDNKEHRCPDCGLKGKHKDKSSEKCSKYTKPVVKCTDCGKKNHPNRMDSRCELFEPAPPQPPAPGGAGGGGRPASPEPGGPLSVPDSDVQIDVTTSGRPVVVREVNGKTLVMLNPTHPNFHDVIQRAANGG